MSKEPKFADDGYTLHVQGRHIEITDGIQSYVAGKLGRVEKIADHMIDVHVVLDAQKLAQSCSIVMNYPKAHIKVQATMDDLYAAIDKAFDRLTRLVRRYKDKLHSYRNKDLTSVDIHVNVIKPLLDEMNAINDEIEAQSAKEEQERYSLHSVVAKDTMPLRTLTQGEAVMKMEISDVPFLIFKAEEDQKIKVIYRREDEHYGIVQVQ